MTEKDQGRFGPRDSSEEELPSHNSKGKQQIDSDFSGIRKSLDESLRDLDSLKPNQPLEQAATGSGDSSIARNQNKDSRNSFERLLREGSSSSRSKNAGQASGCIPLLLIFSFMISLAFPLFWVVFALILIGTLTSSGREWMG